MSMLLEEIKAKIKRTRDNDKRWATMLIYADALEEAELDGRGWRWVANKKYSPLPCGGGYYIWSRWLLSGHIYNCKMPMNIYRKLRRSRGNWATFHTRFAAEEALANAWCDVHRL